MTIEEYLLKPAEKNGKVVIPAELSDEDQLAYIIATNPLILSQKDSKLWRMQHIYYIIGKNRKKVLFKLNRAQLDFYGLLQLGYKKLIILKARQLGFTTFIALYFLDEILFTPDTEALQIAHTLKEAVNIFNKKILYAVKNFHPSFSNMLEMDAKRANRLQFSFPNNSTSAIAVSNSGRSGTTNFLHLSELGKLVRLSNAKAEEVVSGSLLSVPNDGLFIIESTAEGSSGLMYDMFTNAWKRKEQILPGSPEFYPVFYSWRWDDEEIESASTVGIMDTTNMIEGFDWKMFKEELNLSDKELNFYYRRFIYLQQDWAKVHQEMPSNPSEAFIGSGFSYYNSEKIAKDYSNTIAGVRYNRELEEDPMGDVIIYEEPIQGRNYIGTGDTSEGLRDGDNSVVMITGYDKKIKCLFQGKIEPFEYAELIDKIGRYYNNCLLAVEKQGQGVWVNKELLSRGYTNIYFRVRIDDVTQTVSKYEGWSTDATTRNEMLTASKVHFSKNPIYCKPLLEEMMSFVYNKKMRPEAMSGKHDDVVICYSIACSLLKNKTEADDLPPPKKGYMHLIYQ